VPARPSLPVSTSPFVTSTFALIPGCEPGVRVALAICSKYFDLLGGEPEPLWLLYNERTFINWLLDCACGDLTGSDKARSRTQRPLFSPQRERPVRACTLTPDRQPFWIVEQSTPPNKQAAAEQAAKAATTSRFPRRVRTCENGPLFSPQRERPVRACTLTLDRQPYWIVDQSTPPNKQATAEQAAKATTTSLFRRRVRTCPYGRVSGGSGVGTN